MNKAIFRVIAVLACCWGMTATGVLADNATVAVTNLNGDIVTVQLTGAGTLSVTVLNGAQGPIDQVLLEDTTTSSTLTVKVKKSSTGTGIATVNAIIGNGSLKKLSAKPVNIVGTGIVFGGSIGELTINNLTNSAVTIGGLRVADDEQALGKLTCGTLVSSQIQVNGQVGTVTAGRMIDSAVWAGYYPTSAADPMAGGMFSNNTFIATVNVKGIKDTTGPAFLNSTIAAQTMGKITLASVNTNNLGLAFGVLAATFTKSVAVKSPKFQWDSAGAVVQTYGDFEVRQLFSPVVSTDAAANVDSESATLTGNVNPNGLPTVAHFEWGTNTDYGATTAVELIGRGTNLLNHRASITGLTPGATYHFRIVARNNNGIVTGNDQMFTANPPIITPNNMALIPAGFFQMGDAIGEGSVTELPLHAVYLSAFFMDQTEVTQAHWNEVMNWATRHGYNFDKTGLNARPDHPVSWVSWYDCVKWCNARSEQEALTPCYYTDAGQTNVYRGGQIVITNSCVNWNADGYRLPTEAEWEKAARGGARGLRFPWGTTLAHIQATYYSINSLPYDISLTRYYNPIYFTGLAPYTSPAGSLLPNGYGLYDMAGNVWEWCWDWNLYLWYQSPEATEPDPVGPLTGKERLIRGGGWFSTADYCRVAYRNYFLLPHDAAISIGFRCVRRRAVP